MVGSVCDLLDRPLYTQQPIFSTWTSFKRLTCLWSWQLQRRAGDIISASEQNCLIYTHITLLILYSLNAFFGISETGLTCFCPEYVPECNKIGTKQRHLYVLEASGSVIYLSRKSSWWLKSSFHSFGRLNSFLFCQNSASANVISSLFQPLNQYEAIVLRCFHLPNHLIVKYDAVSWSVRNEAFARCNNAWWALKCSWKCLCFLLETLML